MVNTHQGPDCSTTFAPFTMAKSKFQKRNDGSFDRKITDQILEFFREKAGRKYNYKQVAAALGFNDARARTKLIKIMQAMKNDGLLSEPDRGKFTLKSKPIWLTGRIELKRNGVAYVVSDQVEEDIFIPPKFVKHALDGDLVKVYLLAQRKRGRPSGQVVEIIKRAATEFAGTVELSEKFAFLVPDNPNMSVDIYIPIDKINGAKNGEKAIARMTDWPKDSTTPFGEIIDVLGPVGDKDAEAFSILAQHGLPHRFPKDVEDEAAKIDTVITQEEISRRLDFRESTTFTIDPADAKDFDDAISFRKVEDDKYEIGVHIADVTHYVQPDSIIDQEAVDRATSVYLVDRVVPMLPEVLSNGVCSLNPHEDKLTYSCVFSLNNKAEILDYQIKRTVIHSDRRFTYEEVQEILEGGEGDFKVELEKVNELAKILRQKRLEKGSIAFDKVEVRFKLDANKQPESVYFKMQKDAHKLIEEFMLLANRTVAEHIARPRKGHSPRPFVFRIHDRPDPKKILDFALFVKTFGYTFKTKTTSDIASSMNALLSEIQGKREENMLEQLAIRTMAKAEYSTRNIGHYGLSFHYYTHFTSPIRRYPDMLAHRLLTAYDRGNEYKPVEILEQYCKHSSEMERKAADAERDSIKFFQVLFMQDEVGKEFDGIISGVTEWGIYVEIIENKCEGMIRLRDIGGDYFVFDESSYKIIGHNTQKEYQLGDALRIRVEKADLFNRRLDFKLIDTLDD